MDSLGQGSHAIDTHGTPAASGLTPNCNLSQPEVSSLVENMSQRGDGLPSVVQLAKSSEAAMGTSNPFVGPPPTEISKDQSHSGSPLYDTIVVGVNPTIADRSDNTEDSEDEETRQMILRAKALEKEVRKMDRDHERKLAKRRLEDAELAFEAAKKRKEEED